MPGQEPGTLKKPHEPVGSASFPSRTGCQRHSPLRQTRSRVGVFSECARFRSHTAATPAGSDASAGSPPDVAGSGLACASVLCRSSAPAARPERWISSRRVSASSRSGFIGYLWEMEGVSSSDGGKQVGDAHGIVGAGQEHNHLIGTVLYGFDIALHSRLTMDQYLSPRNVHDPILRDSSASIERGLCRAVEAESSVCHFNNHQDIRCVGSCFEKVGGGTAQHSGIGFWFARLVVLTWNLDRQLKAHKIGAEQDEQPGDQTCNHIRMLWPLSHFRDNLPLDEFVPPVDNVRFLDGLALGSRPANAVWGGCLRFPHWRNNP